MALPRYHLIHDPQKGDWVLKQEGADRATRRFDRKEDATAGGVLEGAVGRDGGTVRIHNRDGTIQEERTFPRSADPSFSPG